ncbi:helix-turn-helix transcriptional regulator [Oceanobacillus jeddahense]|uniref:YafY family transcriptional regulator n=1 Tax=Oceanobacillus jeddahense TaxID=1462527 RepID=A0ABY5JX62_9BACI|nr:YafY family protein [Oceanobacillus jeddahense]UUI04830.1 YafY family transcriptional regulator [Oceanobacillus jeddahense]
MKESRLFKIMYYLLNKEKATASELAEKFEVSLRTIYRDIDVISSAGIPIYTSTGRNGGVYLVDNFVLNKALLSAEEQQNILMALQNLEVTKNGSNHDTILKLKALFQTHLHQWIDIDFSQWGEYNNVHDIFELIKTAVWRSVQIHFEYANSKGEGSYRVVNPVKLLYKSNAWYLQAFCVDKKDFRMFKLTRMYEIIITDNQFEPLDGPVLDKKSYAEYVHLDLLFSEKIAYRVFDEFNRNYITRQNNGTLLVSIDMPNEEWLIRYLLSFGKFIKILSPASIRSRFLEEVKAMYAYNSDL